VDHQNRQGILEKRLRDALNEEAKRQIDVELKRVREERPPFDFALAVAENGPDPMVTRLLARGDAFSPRETVSPAFPAVFGDSTPALPARPAPATTTGRRSVLADWIAHPSHPLTARVIVNRLWQHHFGAGLVATPDDFGKTGSGTIYPDLLDYLAKEVTTGEWRLKRMHRMIMRSRAYRMSSRANRPEAREIDEANTLFWRQNLRRLEAEVIRDTMLAVSGRLNTRMGGPSVFPRLPPEVHRTQDSAEKGWQDSPADEQDRRSVYLVVKRALKVPLLECLDFANSASPVGVRPVTTTAPQALMLLNDAFVREQAAALSDRLLHETDGSGEPFVEAAFQRVLQRSPSPRERDKGLRFLSTPRESESRIAFCRALLNLNETIYVD
jgi:hypothetical protein